VAAGDTVQYHQDLADPNARAGRTVRLGATAFLEARPYNVQALNANQVLGRFLRGATRKGPDALQVREGAAGFVLETSLEGELAETWTVPALLRSLQEATTQSLLDGGLEVRGVEPAAMDLTAPAREVVLDPTYHDPTGEVNPDFTLNYGTIAEHGAEEGLKNVGETAGKILAAGGSAVGEGLLGIPKGLGVIGTIVAVIILIIVLFLALRVA
jgi:hypothetical protein